MKGQSSVEFVAIIGIALVLAAPFVVEAQESMIDLATGSEDAQFQASLNELGVTAQQVSASGPKTTRTVELRVPDNIERVYEQDRALIFEMDRGGSSKNFSQIFPTDVNSNIDSEAELKTVIISNNGDKLKILEEGNPLVPENPEKLVYQLQNFNSGNYKSTSADWSSDSGVLGLGYLNGSNPKNGNVSQGLAGYWRMDGDSGSVVDYSGNENDGITRNFDGDERGVNGAFGTKAFEFDGSKQYVDVGPHSYRNFTVSFWAKFDGPVNGDESDMVLSNGNIQSKTDFVQLSTPDTNGFGLRVAIGGDSERITWNRIEETGVSKKLTFFTIAKEGKTIEAFYNGTSQGKKTLSSDYKFSIGAIGLGWANNERYSFNGKLDEVKIYNRSLSASEVSQLYLNGRPFTGKYTSKVIDNSESQNWSELEVNASVPSDTDLTATFESLEQGPLQTAQSYASPSEWNLGSFNTTTADNVVVEKQNVSMLEASKPSEFNEGNFNQTTSFNRKPPLDKFETSSQTDFNGGTFKYTSADRGDNSGDLGIGYLNGTKSGQPENNGLNNKSMVGYWRLDKEVSDGETAVDYSGEDNDGSLNTGGNTASGSSGILSTKAFNFDGNDDYLSVPDSSSLDQGSALTVSFWMKADSYPNRRNAFIGKEDWNSGTGWVIYDDGGELYFEQAGGTGIEGSWSRNTGEWYHIVATSVDGGAAKIYVDGDQISSGSVPLSVNDAELNIGSRHQNSGTGSKDNIDGTMDEVRIYNRSLSQPEVEDLYFQGRNGEFTGSYTAKDIDKNQETSWNKLKVNASIHSETSVNATFKALDTDGNLVDSQLIDLSEGLSNYSLSVSNSEDAEVFINGTSSNVTKSWEVHGLEVFSREVEDKNEGLRIGYQNGSAGDDLVGYWRLDRNVSGSGGTVKDYSGNDNNGLALNFDGDKSRVEGIFGTQGFGFNGDNNVIDLGPNLVDGESELTVTAWIYTEEIYADEADCHSGSGSPDIGSIILKSGRNGNDNFAFCLENDNQLTVYYDDGSSSFAFDSGETSINPNEWHFVATTYDSSQNLHSLYLNQTMLTEDSTATGSLDSTNNNLNIGRRTNGLDDREWNGKMDEVQIYNRSLSDSEIKDIYFKGRPFQGNYTAEKIDNSQETSWEEVEINASVPSDTNLTAEFEALDSDDSVVDRELIDVTGGSSPVNYSLNVQASESARLSFNGTSSNVTKTWIVYDYEVFSGERQVDESESFSVEDGLNEFSLGVSDSKDARVRLNGTSSEVTQSWSVSNISVFS